MGTNFLETVELVYQRLNLRVSDASERRPPPPPRPASPDAGSHRAPEELQGEGGGGDAVRDQQQHQRDPQVVQGERLQGGELHATLSVDAGVGKQQNLE